MHINYGVKENRYSLLISDGEIIFVINNYMPRSGAMDKYAYEVILFFFSIYFDRI